MNRKNQMYLIQLTIYFGNLPCDEQNAFLLLKKFGVEAKPKLSTSLKDSRIQVRRDRSARIRWSRGGLQQRQTQTYWSSFRPDY